MDDELPNSSDVLDAMAVRKPRTPARAQLLLPAPEPLSASEVLKQWTDAWPAALATWSSFTMLREPRFFKTEKDAKTEQMAGEIAAIRLVDQTVMVNLKTVRELKIESLAVEVLAHEIGHHVYVPGNLTDNARMIAAIKPVYSGMPNAVTHMLANLYGDLMINDRLQRRAGLDMAGVYKKLKERARALKDSKGNDEPPSRVWQIYTRTYEHLWRLAKETLSPEGIDADTNLDAVLISRLIRHYAGDWLRGVRRFAYIMYPYVFEDEEKKREQTFSRLGLRDTRRANASPDGADAEAIPNGLTGIEDFEKGEDDSFEKEIMELGGGEEHDGNEGEPRDAKDRTGRATRKTPTQPNTVPTKDGKGSAGQFREPFQYGELLKALGLNLTQHQITARYYRERALPHLIPFPQRLSPHVTEPLAEGTESWEAGDALDDLDILSSVLRSPVMIPGVTTERRVFGESPGQDPARAPMDLDIYIDCSGSMPNPAVNTSYLALAGTILALSALRAGARVQATLWSGAGQFDTSGGFIRDEARIMGIVTGYICGATAFPLNVLRDTYRHRKADDAPAHIVIVSDDGIDTILNNDEKGTSGGRLCMEALARARGGATMVLNLPSTSWTPAEELQKLGFAIHRVTSWDQLIAFAREFVWKNYEN